MNRWQISCWGPNNKVGDRRINLMDKIDTNVIFQVLVDRKTLEALVENKVNTKIKATIFIIEILIRTTGSGSPRDKLSPA